MSNQETKNTEVMGNIAKNWKELSGEKNWEGLLDPLDSNLCKCITHYGERVQAIYDAFDTPLGSPPCVPKHIEFPPCAPKNLFSIVGLEKGNRYKYTLTNYLYGLSDVISPLDWVVKDRSAWIGYVAVATDEGKAALGRRDILICWRGTVLTAEWLKDIELVQTSASDILNTGTTENHNPMVHEGFHSLYISSNSDCKYNTLSARQQVLEAVRKLVDKYKDEEVSITIAGHSLGSALATLNAADIVANGCNKSTGSNIACMVTAFVFASPKVGNSDFKAIFQGLPNLHLLHIRNQHDIVPKIPLSPFVKLGKELRVDATKSTYLKIPLSLVKRCTISHHLEIYLHGVAPNQEIPYRDISLVNKWLDVLKDEYNVPPKWWKPEKNFEGMVQRDDGTWKLASAEE